MDKHQFNNLLNNFAALSIEEASEISALREQFPYSQLLQAMAARAARDHQWKDQNSLLQTAAVYATDRSVLKEVLSALPPKKSGQKEISSRLENKTPVTAPIKGLDYADEVVHDLERLQELKHNFESLFSDKKEGAITTLPKTELLPKAEIVKKRKSKKEKIIELAKKLDTKDSVTSMKGSKKTKPPVDSILEEIKSTKKKISPGNEKTKEQIQIIDQFIKSKPVIPPPSPAAVNADLASTLKSGEFGDNIVSETLVEILLRQGKKEKAIEVLKKLIWKFPQKKAYFAAQIEDLRK